MEPRRKPKRKKAERADKVTSSVQCAAGARVPLTGIYLFQHTCSRPRQEVVAVRGRRFPACAECKTGGEYLLKRAAPLVDEDPDFEPRKAAARRAS